MNKFPDTLEDLTENPSAYGIPTFDEYCKNKERWVGRYDDEIASIDRGDQNLKCKQRYYLEHYPVDSLEQAERIAGDMGLSLYNDFIHDPQVVPDSSVKGYHIRVTFRSKGSLAKRANW